MKGRGTFPGIATTDVMINLVFVFAVLFKVSIAAMNAESKPSENATKDTLYLIKLIWAGDSKADLDLYAEDPLKHLVFFKSLQSGLMNLERDDTGSTSNTVRLPDGSEAKSAENQEHIDIRGIVPGEYIINCHGYRMAEPVTAEVDLYRIAGGSGVPVHKQALSFDHQGQEETAFRFTLTAAGEIVGINRLPKKLTNPK